MWAYRAPTGRGQSAGPGEPAFATVEAALRAFLLIYHYLLRSTITWGLQELGPSLAPRLCNASSCGASGVPTPACPHQPGGFAEDTKKPQKQPLSEQNSLHFCGPLESFLGLI